MVDHATAVSERRPVHRDVKAELDEHRIGRAVAMGLPFVTVTAALSVGATLGAPLAILILAAGILLGVIALFWASLRVLSGDAALPPALEALDATVNAVDALASRKKMLVRALKDLDNERALGKLEQDDYEQLSHTYRGELKETMARIDASLEPHRPKAEEAVRAYLENAGIGVGSAPETETEATGNGDEEEAMGPRVACAKCATSNEPDATFCKKCGASLTKADDAGEAKLEAGDKKKAEAGNDA